MRGSQQVRVAGRELRRHQHPLVDDRLRGEAREDQVGPGGELGDAADHVELALERVLVAGELVGSGDDELLARSARPRSPCRRRAWRSTGTSRQQTTRWPSASTVRTSELLAARRARAASSRGRKQTRDAVLAGRRQVLARRPRGRSSSGSWSRIPAPSPVLGSAPAAPRCSRFSSAVIAALEPSRGSAPPSRRATNATPHASCSNAGSYSPTRPGGCVRARGCSRMSGWCPQGCCGSSLEEAFRLVGSRRFLCASRRGGEADRRLAGCLDARHDGDIRRVQLRRRGHFASKTIETMRLSRKSGPDLPARLLRLDDCSHRLGYTRYRMSERRMLEVHDAHFLLPWLRRPS